MGRHVKAIVIEPGRPPEVRPVPGDDRAALKAILGCPYLEVVRLGDGVIGYTDDGGKGDNRPENLVATRIWRSLGLPMIGDWIAGPMVVLGVGSKGHHADVPKWVIRYAESLWRDPATPHLDPNPRDELKDALDEILNGGGGHGG
jgi:hypothetical protein